MNKFTLLIAMGLAAKAQDEFTAGSQGWYAGDCLDDTDFSDYYGYVDWDCGTNCYSNFKGGATDNSSGGSFYYEGCYYDSYGAIDISVAQPCNTFAEQCGYDTECQYYVALCYGDENCMYDAICYGAEDVYACEQDVLAGVTASSRRLRIRANAEERFSPSKKAFSYGDYPFAGGVVIYGKATTSSDYPAYCDHYHLYSFYYETVTPASTSDFTTDLNVWGFTMTGFPGACSYVDWLAI